MLQFQRRRDSGLCLLGIAAALICLGVVAERRPASAPALCRPRATASESSLLESQRVEAPSGPARSQVASSATVAPHETAALEPRSPGPATAPTTPTATGSEQLAGVVMDERGWPIEEAELIATAQLVSDERGHALKPTAPARAVTAVDGSFAIDALPPGTYQLTVAAEGFASQSRILAVPTRTALELELRPAGLLAGFVTGLPASSPHEDYVVQARGLIDSEGKPLNGSSIRTKVAPDGRFLFDALPAAARVLLSVHSARRGPGVHDVARSLCPQLIAHVDGPDLRLELVPRASVRFGVRDPRDGEPVDSLSITLHGERFVKLEPAPETSFERTGPGTFVLHDVPLPSGCELKLSGPGGARAARMLHLPPHGGDLELGTIELDLRNLVHFEVVDATDGSPLDRASLSERGAGGARLDAHAFSSDGGRAMLLMPVGSNQVSVDRRGYVSTVVRCLVADGPAHEPQRIELERAAKLTILVRDAAGEPVPSCGVRVESRELLERSASSQRAFTLDGRDRTDESGRVRRFGLPAGVYTVALFEPLLRGPGALPGPDALQSLDVHLAAGEQRTLELRAAPRADVELQFTLGGSPLSNARVLPVSGGPALGRTDSAGRLRLSNARAGTLALSIGPAGEQQPFTVQVVLDGSAVIQVEHVGPESH